MKPSISALPGITQKAYDVYAASIKTSIASGHLPVEVPPPAWGDIFQWQKDAYQRAAYSAIVFVTNPLLPLSGQCYNGYMIQLEELGELGNGPDWIVLNPSLLEAWHQFGLAVRSAYEVEASK
jgi:hypothetical protein